MLKRTASAEPFAVPARQQGMTAARRSPLAITAGLFVALLVGVLPASAVAVAPVASSAVGAVVHHHLTIRGLVRAEIIGSELHSDGALGTVALAGLVLLGWARRRPARLPLVPASLPTLGGRDPPRVA